MRFFEDFSLADRPKINPNVVFIDRVGLHENREKLVLRPQRKRKLKLTCLLTVRTENENPDSSFFVVYSGIHLHWLGWVGSWYLWQLQDWLTDHIFRSTSENSNSILLLLCLFLYHDASLAHWWVGTTTGGIRTFCSFSGSANISLWPELPQFQPSDTCFRVFSFIYLSILKNLFYPLLVKWVAILKILPCKLQCWS